MYSETGYSDNKPRVNPASWPRLADANIQKRISWRRIYIRKYNFSWFVRGPIPFTTKCNMVWTKFAHWEHFLVVLGILILSFDYLLMVRTVKHGNLAIHLPCQSNLFPPLREIAPNVQSLSLWRAKRRLTSSLPNGIHHFLPPQSFGQLWPTTAPSANRKFLPSRLPFGPIL